MRKNRKKILSILILVSSIALTGCESKSKAQNQQYAPQGKTTLNIGLEQRVPTLDPDLVGDVTSARVSFDLFEGLVSQNQANEVVPGVAKSWDISKDGLVYTFHLRKDAKWSNGQPVTAQDFVYGIKRELNPATGAPNNTMYTVIKNGKAILNGKADPNSLAIKAINPSTLQITLQNPTPYFLQILTTSGAFPVYIPAVEKNPKGWAQAGTLVGNGAYQLEKWIPNGYILLKKNPYYWDKKDVKVENIKFIPITNPSDALNNYKAGQIDMTDTLPTGLTNQQYKKQFGSQFFDITMLANAYINFNVKAKGFDNVQVRKALTMTVDRKAIINSILRMGQTPSYSIFPDDIQGGIYKGIYKQTPGYGWVDEPMTERIKQAKTMLKSLGYSNQNPLTVTLYYYTNPGVQQITEAVAQMWNNAFGSMVQVKFVNEEWKVYLQRLQNKNYQLAFFSWVADYNQAINFVGQYTCDSANNTTQLCLPEVEKQYKLALEAKTQKAYNSHIKNAIIDIMQQYPTIPIYNLTYFRLVKPYVGGYNPKDNHADIVYSKWLYLKHKP